MTDKKVKSYNPDSIPMIISTTQAVSFLGIERSVFEPLMERLGVEPIITSADRAKETHKKHKRWSKLQLLDVLLHWQERSKFKPHVSTVVETNQTTEESEKEETVEKEVSHVERNGFASREGAYVVSGRIPEFRRNVF